MSPLDKYCTFLLRLPKVAQEGGVSQEDLPAVLAVALIPAFFVTVKDYSEEDQKKALESLLSGVRQNFEVFQNNLRKVN